MKEQRVSVVAGSRWTLALVLGVALAIRAPGLYSMPLWRDERYTLALAREAISELFREGVTFHPPVYPILAGAFDTLLPSTLAIRLPALLGGLVGIAAGYGLSRTLAGKGVALATALALTVSVYHVNYSQEARGYSWMSALTGVACLLAVAHLREPSPRRLAGALAAALGATLFHFLAVPSSAVIALALLGADAARFRRGQGERGSAATWLAFVLGATLIAFLMRGTAATVLDHVPAAASTRLALSPRFFAELGGRWSGTGPVAGGVLTVLAVLGIVPAMRSGRVAGALLLIVVLAPIAFVVAVPWSRSFESRYLMAALIPAAALAASGAGELIRWSRAPSQVAALALATVTLIGLAWQLRATATHVGAPAKYSPATGSSPFGLRHVVLHSITDPWLLTPKTSTDFDTTPRTFAQLTLPLPPWGGEWIEERTGGELHARFRNGRADEFVNIVARAIERPKGWPLERPAEDTLLATDPTPRLEARPFERRVSAAGRAEKGWSGAYRHPGTGATIAYREVSWYCAATGRQIWITVRSARLELSKAYLGEVVRSARCH